jgi:hypothetical protein
MFFSSLHGQTSNMTVISCEASCRPMPACRKALPLARSRSAGEIINRCAFDDRVWRARWPPSKETHEAEPLLQAISAKLAVDIPVSKVTPF